MTTKIKIHSKDISSRALRQRLHHFVNSTSKETQSRLRRRRRTPAGRTGTVLATMSDERGPRERAPTLQRNGIRGNAGRSRSRRRRGEKSAA